MAERRSASLESEISMPTMKRFRDGGSTDVGVLLKRFSREENIPVAGVWLRACPPGFARLANVAGTVARTVEQYRNPLVAGADSHHKGASKSVAQALGKSPPDPA
jgi:hypothetical protein